MRQKTEETTTSKFQQKLVMLVMAKINCAQQQIIQIIINDIETRTHNFARLNASSSLQDVAAQ